MGLGWSFKRCIARGWRSTKPCVSPRSVVCLFNKMSSAKMAPPCDFDCCLGGGGASQESLGGGLATGLHPQIIKVYNFSQN